MTTASLRPDETIQKILLSTTSRLIGAYERDDMALTHAWPDLFASSGGMRWARTEEGPASRNAFVLAFRTEPTPKTPGVAVPDYSPMGEVICSYLAVLFGKRFDSHGLIEGSGLFHLPNLSAFGQLSNHMLPHNSHAPRVDFPVPMNLVELSRIERLFDGSADPKFLRTFRGSAKFYLRALQTAEDDPEVAYLHLITAGEILSNFRARDSEDLLDADIRQALQKIASEVSDGARLARLIAGRMRQIKKRFVLTLGEFVNPEFFDRTESRHSFGRFVADTFGVTVSSAYDLRSRYVHTGVPFGHWVSPWTHEVQIGEPVVGDKELTKILAKAPTLTGLSRVVRYCLLRFASTEGVYIESAETNKNQAKKNPKQ